MAAAATPCKDLGAKRRPRAGLDGEARPAVCGIREALGHQLVYVVVVAVVRTADIVQLAASAYRLAGFDPAFISMRRRSRRPLPTEPVLYR
jgi:hypothetical protein